MEQPTRAGGQQVGQRAARTAALVPLPLSPSALPVHVQELAQLHDHRQAGGG